MSVPAALLLVLLPLHLLLDLLAVVALVVQRPPLRICEQLVGVPNLLEGLFGECFGLISPPRMPIGVPLQRCLFVAGLDFLLRRELSSRAAQHLV